MLREARGALEQARALAGAREREGDLLDFELEEIERAEPDEAEHEQLHGVRRAASAAAHRDVLRAATAWPRRRRRCRATARRAARTTCWRSRRRGWRRSTSGIDPRLDAIAQRVRSLALEAQDAATELVHQAQELEAQPGELEAVEERLAALERLMRKHGGTIASVLEHGQRCRARRVALAGALDECERLAAAASDAERDLETLAGELHDARAQAGPRLAAAVCERLEGLAMPGAAFAVVLSAQPPGPAGADAVEMMIATNPGVAAAPVREVASGGELSRIMLALMGIASDAPGTTLVFDEVDAGIGGHTARAVGEQLRGLAGAHQVLCITHLPQIASLGERHFSVTKDTSVQPARTVVVALDERETVSELVRMLGAGEDDAAARRHARELRRAA